MPRSPQLQKRIRTRTCVGCGRRDAATAASGLVRVVAASEGGLEFDFSGRARGRGAYVHARPACLDHAPRGLARALRLAHGSAASGVAAAELGRHLGAACNRRITTLLLAARRMRAVRAGQSHTWGAADDSPEPLTIVAVDSGSAASSPEVQRAVARGRAFAWGTRSELGALFGTTPVASCAIEHQSLAVELIRTRAAADAAWVAAAQAAMQRSRRPEAR
jgi:uncharacterized protein